MTTVAPGQEWCFSILLLAKVIATGFLLKAASADLVQGGSPGAQEKRSFSF
jgi:hypothetical protein